MKKLLLASVLGTFAITSYAEGGYLGIQFSQLDVEGDAAGYNLDTEPTAFAFTLGHKFNPNFAVEGTLGIGQSDDGVEIQGNDTGVDFEVDTYIGINAVGIVPLGDLFSLYGKLGIMSVEYSDSDGDKAEAAGIAYGVGAAVNPTEHLQVSLEYLVFPDGDYDDYKIDVDANALSLGLKLMF